MNHLFEDLKHANKAGVYRLVNKLENSCYILQSSNMAKSLVRLLSSNLYFPEFEFEILEIVTNNINLRPRCQYFKDLYSSNGWTIINNKRVSSLKVHIEVIDDFRDKNSDTYLLAVKLVSKGYKNFIVGVFDSYTDMDEFLHQYYAANLVTGIYYCNNPLTKEYREYLNNVR